MIYKPAAGLYVGGITSVLAGPLIVFIAVTFGTRAAVTNPANDLSGLFQGAMIFGGLLSVVGVILLVGSVYRALVKIDALPVMLSSENRETSSSDRW